MNPRRSNSAADDCVIYGHPLIYVILFIIVLVFVVIIGIFTFAKVESHVVGASLTQFDLNTTNNKTLQLDYNLTVDIDVKNPNRLLDIKYDEIKVEAFYAGNSFADSVDVMHFFQRRRHKKNKTTTTIHPVFHGQSLLVGIPSGKYSQLIDGFNRDKSNGRFDIQVQLHLKVRYQMSWITERDPYHYWLKCDLKRVPLIISSTTNSSTSPSSSSNHFGGDDFRIETECKLQTHSTHH